MGSVKSLVLESWHGSLFVALGALAIFWAASLMSPQRDPREPAYVHSSLPWIGHLIGMMRYGASYFAIVNHDSQHPIFTLPVLTRRTYIVADPALAGHVQRNGQKLSFYALVLEVTRRLIALDDDATRIAFHNVDGKHGPGGLMAAVHEMMNRYLGPGPGLDSLTEMQMAGTSAAMTTLASRGLQEVSLYAWLQHTLGMCNARAIYGPENIFAVHPELEEAFWDFENGMLGLVVNFLPWLFTRKAYKGRQRVLQGLVEYVKEKRHLQASALIRERVETNLAYGMSEEMAGHAELVLMFGIMGNAVPSTFWLVVNIYSRSDLLRQIRREVQSVLDAKELAAVVSTNPLDTSEGMTKKVTVSAKRIAASCPLLYSCYRETLRDVSLLTSARLVLEDTMLADRYHLRQGSVVQIAGGVIHHDERIWGSDAAVFNAERFLVPAESQAQRSQYHYCSTTSRQAVALPKSVPSAAFRAFGGGNVICPGRYFAQSELMTIAAVLALGFDCTETDGSPLRRPEMDDTRIPLSVIKPKRGSQNVHLGPRAGWENVRWDIGV